MCFGQKVADLKILTERKGFEPNGLECELSGGTLNVTSSIITLTTIGIQMTALLGRVANQFGRFEPTVEPGAANPDFAFRQLNRFNQTNQTDC